jgi:diacylglycerol kinase (ATP)
LKNQPFARRLAFAWRGIVDAVGSERSMRSHSLAFALVLGVLVVTRPSPGWWAALISAAALVLITELLNTALEALADHFHPEIDPLIARAKDCAAGAVLVAAVAAIAVAAAFVAHLAGEP